MCGKVNQRRVTAQYTCIQVTAAGGELSEYGHLGEKGVDSLPALGLAWSHCVNTRIVLDKGGRLSPAAGDDGEVPRLCKLLTSHL